MQAPRARIPTIRAFLEQEYLPSLEGHLARITITRQKAILMRLVEAFGSYRVSDIAPPQLEEFRNSRTKTLHANSLRAEWAIVRRFFAAAVKAGYIQANPARAVGLPRETRGPDRILTEEEQDRLLKAFWATTMRDVAEFALWTALRPGELCGLQGRHADLQGARLYVPQPKAERPKILPLIPEAIAILKRQPPFGPDDPVFRGPYRGQTIRLNVYRRAFKRAVEQARIAPIPPRISGIPSRRWPRSGIFSGISLHTEPPCATRPTPRKHGPGRLSPG